MRVMVLFLTLTGCLDPGSSNPRSSEREAQVGGGLWRGPVAGASWPRLGGDRMDLRCDD